MKLYHKILIICLTIVFSGEISFAQPVNNTNTSIDLKKLNINYMLRGYFYVRSAIEDTSALGGFASSDNVSKQIVNEKKEWESLSGLSLFIDTTSHAIFSKGYEGYKVFLINKSGTTTSFPASDSRLSIFAEVFHNNRWIAAEYLPSSWCGNSYHTAYLKDNEYWEFNVPRYAGKIKTKLRYKLIVNKEKTYYSNEIIAFINRNQLTLKQGHTPQNIMDPYND